MTLFRRSAPALAPRARYPGGATTYLYEHRAFTRLPHRGRVFTGALLLTALATAAWLLILPVVMRAWGYGLVALGDALDTGGSVVMTLYDAGRLGTFGVPHLSLTAAHPDPWLIGGTGLVTVLLFVASFGLPERWTPGLYVLRAALLMQISAVVYFALWGDRFPYTLDDYLRSVVATGVLLTTATLPVLGLTYYVQDVSWAKKAGLTLGAVGYAALLVPLQYAVHAVVLHHVTLLFLPLLYLLFGVPLHVLTLVALYAWGMSWKGHHPTLGLPVEPDYIPASPPLRRAA